MVFRRILTGVCIALSAGIISLITTSPAFADREPWQWDDPPTCFKGSQTHANRAPDGTINGVGRYTYTHQAAERRFYGGGYELRHYWYYQIEAAALTGPRSMDVVTIGWARKHCGTTWHPYTA